MDGRIVAKVAGWGFTLLGWTIAGFSGNTVVPTLLFGAMCGVFAYWSVYCVYDLDR